MGPRNAYFDFRAMVGWLLNATYQVIGQHSQTSALLCWKHASLRCIVLRT